MSEADDKLVVSAPRLVIPELEPGEEWLSVIVHVSDANFSSPELLRESPPIADRFQLSEDFWIEHLEPTMARAIVDACSPSNFAVPVFQQQDHTYAFVKRTRIPGVFNDFGGLDELAAVIAMSRLIHFTSTGLRYAARVSLVNDQVKQILAFQPRGVSVDIFTSKSSGRNWLTVADAARLKALMPLILTRRPLPKRVHNAHWHHEYAMRTYYVDHRWVFVVTGLEALTNTSPYQGQKKFVSRVRRLANLAGIAFTEAELGRGYGLRSGLVHGQQFLSEQTSRLTDEDSGLYDRLEETLRRTILHAFEDDTFAINFQNEASINSYLPIP
jgi:hypothetical protein